MLDSFVSWDFVPQKRWYTCTEEIIGATTQLSMIIVTSGWSSDKATRRYGEIFVIRAVPCCLYVWEPRAVSAHFPLARQHLFLVSLFREGLKKNSKIFHKRKRSTWHVTNSVWYGSSDTCLMASLESFKGLSQPLDQDPNWRGSHTQKLKKINKALFGTIVHLQITLNTL